MPAYCRAYRPLASGDSYSELAGEDDIMIAMLVPERFRDALTFRQHRLDVGVTMMKTLKLLGDKEFAIELGGQSYSLSHEMHLGNQAMRLEEISNNSIAAGRIFARIARQKEAEASSSSMS
eukprot:67158-Pyramimonas_sp.AAC.1